MHQSPAQFDFALFGFEQPFQSSLQFFGDLVNHVVAANLYAPFVGQLPSVFVGHHVETHDNCVRGVCQRDVSLADATHGGLQQLHPNFGMFELAKFLLNRFDRAADVGPQNEIQSLNVVGAFQAIEQVL